MAFHAMEFYGNAMEAPGEPRKATEVHRIPKKFPRISMAILWNSVGFRDFHGALRSCLENRGIPWCSKDLRGVPRFSLEIQDFHGKP